MFTNINIKENDHQYHYIVEYQIGEISNISDLSYTNDLSFWVDDDEKYVKNCNCWNLVDDQLHKTYMPGTSKKSQIILYLPQFSADTYKTGVTYALNVGIWIKNHYISFGSFIFNRLNAVACDRVKTFMSNEYYECIKFDIIDPFTFIYSDDWKSFREILCGEVPNSNSCGSILYFSLHPVEKTDIGYIKDNDYIGGQNSINISKKVDDYLRLNLSTNVHQHLKDNEEPAFIMDVSFNNEYNGNLQLYIQETYGIQNPTIKYNLVIGNEENVYAMIEETPQSITDTYSVNKTTIVKQNFKNWDGWVPGISVVGSIDILDEYGDSVLYLLSNKLKFDHRIYKYFVQSNDLKVAGKSIHSINLNFVDMNLYNIETVNKIENKIVQLSRQEDVKSNLIQPIFFRSVDSSSISIHPSVTETICVNLDIYKSKIDSFIIQIEGVHFPEIGRNQSGVLFKIIGNKLPKDNSEGTYFILDHNADMVTSGKYTYIY